VGSWTPPENLKGEGGSKPSVTLPLKISRGRGFQSPHPSGSVHVNSAKIPYIG
jgi:hypothetical protein